MVIWKMKKLENLIKGKLFYIDEKCSWCKDVLKKIKEHKLTNDDVIVLNPDINAFGILTHYHLDIITKKELKHLKRIVNDK